MKKNNKVDTAKNGQTANKNTSVKQKNVTAEQLENRKKNKERRKKNAEMKERTEKLLQQKKITERVAKDLNAIEDVRKKKNNSPVGKVVVSKDTEDRKKAREKQYAAFRIAALKRRCERMKLSEKETNEYVEKLKKQLKEPNEYNILVKFNEKDVSLVKEALKNKNLTCKMFTDTYLYIDGNQDTLGVLREIMPSDAKIYPYAKKKDSVLPASNKKYSGYVAKNTDKSSTAKYRRLTRKAEKLCKKFDDLKGHGNHKLDAELKKKKRLAAKRKLKKALKMLHKKLQKASKKSTGTVVRMSAKTPSKGSKIAKKAA